MVSIVTRRILMQVVRVLLLNVILTGFMASPAQAAKPPAEAFFRNAALSQLRLSPNGRSVGMLVASENGRMQLGVIDLASMTPTVVAGFSGEDIADYDWVNDGRLIFWMADQQTAVSDQRLYSGLYAVNRDGTEMRMLVDRTWKERTTGGSFVDRKILPADVRLAKGYWPKQSDHVFVVQPAWNSIGESEAINLIRLNTRTGSTTSYDRPGNSASWTIDHTGTPRITMTNEGARYAIHYRDPATDRWRKIAEYDRFSPDGFEPHSFGPDGTFYVLAQKGRDTEALYRYDLVNNVMDPQPLVAAAGYDILPTLLKDFQRKKLAGIHFETDAASSVWFDERMKEAQKTIDQMLPATINRLSFGSHSDISKILVHAFSDVQPGRYLIYDAATRKLSLLGDENPAINPKEMAQRDMVRYKARDGLEIPAYLTLPQGSVKKNLPMVVLVHGGPWVRGSTWEWEANVQFLASRGYAVLQPEFRGSTGFGSNHFFVGWKQWGLAMQDDIADGAKWAIAQGIADPKRICIAGASYGGYATLMGLAKHSDMFRCGINMFGVTDINQLYQSSWIQDTSTDSQHFSLPSLIGDPVKDAEQLKATSPVNIADRIKQPVLMVYGGSDYRVPIKHGRLFRDAVKPYNPNVEWIEYLNEGHGLSLVKNRVEFWTRAEAFLEKYIGK